MCTYPRAAQAATIKCIDCNSPVVTTVDDDFVCVECGESPITKRKRAPARTP